MSNSLRDQIIDKGIAKELEFKILKVNFGQIDSDSDTNLYDYFLDDNYIDKVVNSNISFITGRKGTGKTALYRWIKYSEMKNGYICSNMNLTDLNQSDFSDLKDENKASYSVYQTIWEYTILCEISRMIVFDENCYFHSGDYQTLRQYVNFFFGKNPIEMHKLVLQFTSKKGASVVGPPLNLYYGKQENYTLDKRKFVSLSIVNRSLTQHITNYLIDNPEKKFVLQFDGLDNDYNYESFDNYKKIIISLLTATYNLNNEFISNKIGLKVLSYLRTDIFRAVHDFHPNSAKWTFLTLELDWAIKSEGYFASSKLKEMIDIRIRKSLPDLPQNIDAFEYLFLEFDKAVENKTSHFSDYLKRTMFRPRDLIALCIYTQNKLRFERKYNTHVDKLIRKEYIIWFWSEISNEINTIINPEILKRFIQRIGNTPKSYEQGKQIFDTFCEKEKAIKNNKTGNSFIYQELMEYLFKFGIIVNINKQKSSLVTYLSIIRNPLVEFNYKLEFQINECLKDLNYLQYL